jgi:hypothetical protein
MKQREPLTREAEGKMLGRNEEGLITILGVVRDGGFVHLEPAEFVLPLNLALAKRVSSFSLNSTQQSTHE